MYDKVRDIVKANQSGSRTYLYPIYTYYFPLLSNKLKEMTQNIFAQYNVPTLPVSFSFFFSFFLDFHIFFKRKLLFNINEILIYYTY